MHSSMELAVVRASLVSERRRLRSVRMLQQIIAGSLKSGRRIALSGGTRVHLVAANDSRTLLDEMGEGNGLLTERKPRGENRYLRAAVGSKIGLWCR